MDEKPGQTEGEAKPEPLNLLDKAERARTGLAVENERLEKNLKELRELTARQILGGMSEAGQQPVKKPELDPREYARMALSGKFTSQ